jgi:signal transduction histidine kinase
MPPAGFKFEVVLPDKEVMTERNKLFQVLTHLIKNGYMHHHNETGKIKITGTEDDGKIKFCVEDDGPGIHPDSHQLIFDVFHTLFPKDKKETTGMGLSIVKKVVESYGGTITVESDGKKGTKFYFTWPV